MASLDMKFNEVTKSLVRSRHMFGSMGIFGSTAKLPRLSKEQTGILEAADREATEWSNKTISEPGEQEAYKKLVVLGVEVADPTRIEDWSNPMKPMWTELTAKTPGSDRFLKIILETQ